MPLSFLYNLSNHNMLKYNGIREFDNDAVGNSDI